MNLFFLRKYYIPEEIILRISSYITEKDQSKLVFKILKSPELDNLRLLSYCQLKITKKPHKTILQNLFIEALIEGDHDKAKLLYSKGIDINLNINLGSPYLESRIRSKFYSLKNDLNFEDTLGCNLLHLATLKGFLDIVKLLIKDKADVNARITTLSGEDYQTGVALHLSIVHSHDKISKFLIENGSHFEMKYTFKSISGTPLELAAEMKRKKVVELLIRKGAYHKPYAAPGSNVYLNTKVKDEKKEETKKKIDTYITFVRSEMERNVHDKKMIENHDIERIAQDIKKIENKEIARRAQENKDILVEIKKINLKLEMMQKNIDNLTITVNKFKKIYQNNY